MNGLAMIEVMTMSGHLSNIDEMPRTLTEIMCGQVKMHET